MIPEMTWPASPDAGASSAAVAVEAADLLLKHGAVLLKDAQATSPAALAAVRDALGLEPAACADRFARRTDLGDGVYSWPDWAADREMCLHHEQSQGRSFPGALLLANLAPAQSGGAMLLGDSRAVLAGLPTELTARFRTHGWTLIRNFRRHLGLSWQEAFGVEDREGLEFRCVRDGIEPAWSDDGTLRTTQHRPAVVAHPQTGEECWFNDVEFFSQWSVPAEERKVLLNAFGESGIPLNTASGDGAPLTEAEYEAISDAYVKTTTRVGWQPGDVLLIDNILAPHGREPYTGNWSVGVAPVAPVSL